jgi:hypothetical protein
LLYVQVTVLQALNFNPSNPTAYNNRGFARRKVLNCLAHAFAALSCW